jgi:hypothetical protein
MPALWSSNTRQHPGRKKWRSVPKYVLKYATPGVVPLPADIQQLNYYVGDRLEAVVSKQPPAKPHPDDVFTEAFDALMRHKTLAAPSTPADSFEATATRLLRGPGRGLPANWRPVEKASTQEAPHLLQFYNGQRG